MTGAAPTLADLQAAVADGDLDAAADLARAALVAGLAHPLVFRFAARDLVKAGRGDEAVTVLRRGLTLAPKDPQLLTALGEALARLDRWVEAAPVFEAAAAADPTSADAAFGAGESLAALGDVVGARARLEQALALNPSHVEANATLANLLARTGDAENGRRRATATLMLSPGHPTAMAALAAADVGDARFTEAEARLRFMVEPEPPGAGLEPLLHAACLSLLADALHGQGRAAEAFDAYTRANAELKRLCTLWEPAAERFLDLIARLTARFERDSRDVWSAAPPSPSQVVGGGVSGHVFLMGFHRSGTTLLEQILAAHPRVSTLEEKDLLRDAAKRFFTRADGLDALVSLDGETAARLREGYWRRAREAGADLTGKLFVDKMPLDTVNLPLVAKLFPEARVLFARRDPRDVVLSCFRHFFATNAATYAMLTLDGAAQLYASVMHLAQLYRAALPLAVHEVRHERLVADFDPEMRAVCDFLGLEWSDAIRDFAVQAQDRAIVTPSAGQVRRGLYREAEAPWRLYREQLAPVLPILAPWVEKFGYPTD